MRTSSSRTSRRQFLSNTATVGLCPLIGCTNAIQPSFEVDLYVSEGARRGQSVNHAAAFLEQRFANLYGAELDVGPTSVVEVPDYDDLQELAAWWYRERTHDAEHASILCVDYDDIPDWWGYTYRYGEPPAVVRFASDMNTQAAKWTVLHEVGHCLDARHHHASRETIMNHKWSDVDKSDLQYSTRAKQIMLENL